MAVDVKIPEIGESINEGFLAEWSQQDGAVVEAEAPLLVLETDKITMNVTAEVAGRLEILAAEDGVYRLVFATDPRTRPNEMVWFELPEPSKTSCLSLVVESTFDAGPGKPPALSELAVLTEVDSAAGLERHTDGEAIARSRDHAVFEVPPGAGELRLEGQL